MMKNTFTYLLGILVILISFSSCQKDGFTEDQMSGMDAELMDALESAGGTMGMNRFVLPESNEYHRIPQDPNNPLSSIKVELGKKLFYETGLGTNPSKPDGMGTYSCASCHVPGSNFQAGIRQGIGEGGSGFGIAGEARLPNASYDVTEMDLQPIRTPTAIHSAYNRTSLWNGQFGAVGPNVGTDANWTVDTPKETNNLGYEGTEIQAIAGLKVHRMEANLDLIMNCYYKDLFDMSFPEFSENERYSRETIGLAIAAFERTIIANRAPFQNWLKGENNAITDNQKHGAVLFFGKAGCNNCHTGPALNNESFFALGMNDLDGDGTYGDFPELDIINTAKGRGGFTGNSEDDFKFKTPQLYSLNGMNFLGHGASFNSIREVIEYKNDAVSQNVGVPTSQLASEFTPLGLSETEIDQLTDFVENALNDDEMLRYKPSSVASGNCFPNNDEQSQADMGCN